MLRSWCGSLLVVAACGGGGRVDAPAPPPRLALADVVGVWAIGSDWSDAIAIADSGAFLWRATTEAGAGCEVKGVAAIEASPSDDPIAYLSVRIESDTCAEPAPLRSLAIHAHSATELTLSDALTQGAPAKTYARQATP